MESLSDREGGSVLGEGSEASNISEVEWRNKHERRKR
jgi:hypothetical protein